jgi:hypothetical protein
MEHSPELQEQFEAMRKNLGFVPNSILIMQRKPTLARALAEACDLSMIRFMREIRTEVNAATAPRRNAGAVTCEMT